MEWTREVQDALMAPFPDDEIEFLPRASANGRALALAHIDARSVMRRLDAVVGPDGWWFDFEVLPTPAASQQPPPSEGGGGRAERGGGRPAGVGVKGRPPVLGVTECDA